MRILQVCPAYYPSVGGVEEHVRKISEELAKKHEVTVATSDFPKNMFKEKVMDGVVIRRFKYWAPKTAYFFSRGMKTYLMDKSSDFDIVHAHSFHAFPALYAASAKKSNKLVFTPHYIGAGSTRFRKLLHIPYKYWGGSIFKKSDRIISTSSFEKNMIIRRWKVDPNKIVLIPNGVDLENLRTIKNKKDHKSVLCVSRLEKYKGVQYAIMAMPFLSDDVILEIVGRGSFKEKLIALSEKLGVRERVKFHAYLTRGELLQKYADADLFILLSERENFAICVAEALAACTPCIVANRMALQEWIDNKNCYGINFPVDIGKLAELIKSTIGKKVDGLRLLTWSEVAQRIAELYAIVLEE